MEPNDFEKNIKRKLDELKIAPSDSVWAHVEKRVGKKEKDKKVILIFFLLLIFLSTGGYWLLNSLKNNPPQSRHVTQLQKDNKATNKEDSSFEKAKIKSGNNLTTIDSACVSSGRTRVANSQIATNHKTKQRKFSDDNTSKPNQDFSKQTNKKDSQIALAKLIKRATNAEIKNKNESEAIADNFQNQINTDSFLIQLESKKQYKN